MYPLTLLFSLIAQFDDRERVQEGIPDVERL